MASTLFDPNVLDMALLLVNPEKKETFQQQPGLAPTPTSVHPPRLEDLPGHPSTNQFCRVCGELGFNTSKSKLDCVDHVLTYQRKSVKGRRLAFRCTKCQRQLSHLTGTASDVQHGFPGQGSFVFRDQLGHAYAKLPYRKIIWLAFSLSKDKTVDMTKELMHGTFKLSKQVHTDWRRLQRVVV